MSTTYPRGASAGAHGPRAAFRPGSFSNRCSSLDSPSLSPSTSHIDLSRLSSPHQPPRSRTGWNKDQHQASGPPSSYKGFDPKPDVASVNAAASAKFDTLQNQPGLLKQALQTQLAQSASRSTEQRLFCLNNDELVVCFTVVLFQALGFE